MKLNFRLRIVFILFVDPTFEDGVSFLVTSIVCFDFVCLRRNGEERELKYLLGVNDSDIPGEFLDIIYSSCFKPLIGKPTRITTNTATLIDNLFTNVFL